MTPHLATSTWRKASQSGGEGGNCIELHPAGAMRDSKNPDGPTLEVDQAMLVRWVKTDR